MARQRTTTTRGRDEPAVAVRLEPVAPGNRSAVLALELAADQQDQLDSNAESLAEARYDRDARPRAVVAGDRVVGFLMYDASENGEALLYRFMIDRRHQGQGYGRAALEALVREVAALGHVRAIVVSYMPDNEPARRFYRGFGFVEDGEDEDGEVMARLTLAAGAPAK
ncbi:MAG: GNAT family N-acetyltransferase [Hyphomicrobiaceae bacterium]